MFCGSEVDHSSASRAEVKNVWSYTSTPLYAFMACRGTAGVSSVGSILRSRKLTQKLHLCIMHWQYPWLLSDMLGAKTVVVKAPSVFI